LLDCIYIKVTEIRGNLYVQR
jgi:hypothetical protein